MKTKFILDVTCGGRTIWFNKNHPTGKNGNTMWMCFMKIPK